MKKITSALLAAGLAIGSVSVMAMDDSKDMNMKSMDMKMMDPKMMDKDGDGMISKPEFMNAHEMMFDHMKNSQGMVDVKDMQMMKKNMMKSGSGMTDKMYDKNMDKNMMDSTKP